ncbi:unnamed protein product, partial [Ectocarpus sp. 8 AP-2014]
AIDVGVRSCSLACTRWLSYAVSHGSPSLSLAPYGARQSPAADHATNGAHNSGAHLSCCFFFRDAFFSLVAQRYMCVRLLVLAQPCSRKSCGGGVWGWQFPIKLMSHFYAACVPRPTYCRSDVPPRFCFLCCFADDAGQTKKQTVLLTDLTRFYRLQGGGNNSHSGVERGRKR